jgi:hypothetical protein
MLPSVPQTTFSKAQNAKANYSQAAGAVKPGNVLQAAKDLTPEQIKAKLAALEQQVSSLLQRIHDDGAGNIHIATDGNISLHAKEILIEATNKASLSVGLGASVDLNSAGDAMINATGRVKLTAAQVIMSSSTVKMDAAFVEASGVLKANTVLATVVTASTYSPGAGNIW